MSDKPAKCLDCKGTGSTRPDCWLCCGSRMITVKKAYRHRWTKADLQNVEDDGWCDCPLCYESAGYCMFCYGDGTCDALVQQQQRMRVLVFCLNDRIPLVIRHDRHGLLIRDREMDLLSKEATRACRDDGLVSWFSSVFGDELYLTPKGEIAARAAWREYRALLRRWVNDERARRAERRAVQHPRRLGNEARS